MGRRVNVNGVIQSPGEARISVFDRGFLYGDSVYEVVRTYGATPFELPLHLRRLQRSAERIGFQLPHSAQTLTEVIGSTLASARSDDADSDFYVRVVVTRGEGEISLDPAVAEHPNTVVFVQPIKPLPAELYSRGAKVQLVTVRRNLREAVDPAAKTGNYLNNVLALAEAKREGAHEAVLLDHQGRVTEGASSNIFLVVQGRAITPQLDVGILEGITRTVVIELIRELGIALEERVVTPGELESADEVFLTSTLREVLPVTTIGDRKVAQEMPGPVTSRIRDAFRRRARGGSGP